MSKLEANADKVQESDQPTEKASGTVVLPADTGRAWQYTRASWRVDKLLEPDGSVATAAGTVVLPADTGRSWQYKQAPWQADKLLEPDGSVVTSGGSGGGGSATPGGSSGQVQYNSSGAFAGAPGIITDGTNVGVGGLSAVPANPFSVGVGANSYFVVNPPAGTFLANGQITVRPAGTSGTSLIYNSGSSLQLSGGNGANVVLGHYNGSIGWIFPINSGWVNFATFTGTAAGGTPSITASGSDTNIGLNIVSKGTGLISLQPTPGTNNFSFGNYGMFYYYTGEANPRAFIGSVGGTSAVQLVPLGTSTVAAAGVAITTPAVRVLAFQTSNATALTERMRIDGNGNVGIGTGAATLTAPLSIANVPVYANNAAATGAGLTAGALYRTGGDPDQLCIVH